MNHFIEFQTDKEDNLYVMIHCGSRNLGLQVAKHYNNIAKEINKKYYSSVPPEYQLAFLPFDSEEGQMYYKEMKFCVAFAETNRFVIGRNVIDTIQKISKKSLEFEMLDVNHNFASVENHFGKNLIIHRKGATRAYEGEFGIIPGSQGTASYLVKGKGNTDSFKSCSHGAGRVLGRKAAIKTLDLQKEIKKMDDQGIIHSLRHANDLEEAPSAYKDINIVMKDQEDLVDIVTELKPIAVIKG